MGKSYLVVLSVLSLALLCDTLRILVSFPLSSKSHSILGRGVVRHLLDAGHEVVYITSFPHDKPIPRLKEIDVSAIGEEFKKQADQFDGFKLKNLVGKGNIGDSPIFLYFAYEVHKKTLEEPNVAKLLSDPSEKFDAVFIEWFFHNAIAGIASLFQCPLIWMGSTEAHWQVMNLVDEIPNPAYTLDLFSSNSLPLGFWERATELWTVFKRFTIFSLLVTPFEKYLYNRIFSEYAAKRGVTMPSYHDAVYNGSLMFLNSHPSLGIPYRMPQNAKYIAGYHIDSKMKPLPKDLQKVMDDAKHGVIYFSMGSNLQSSDMSDEMRNSLLKMFGQLKQVVIWKFESDLQNAPSNIHLLKWAPQQSILAHPNLKMFITHGGQLSTTEAMHYGVPVIGIPVMADQHLNMRSVQHKGFGIYVLLAENLADELAVSIRNVLSDPSYNTKAKELSEIYHDRVVPPGAELVHWVEHVVRTRGAPHLRSPALHVPWYQKMYLDLAVVVLGALTLLIVIAKRLFRKKSVAVKQQQRTKKRN